jgi:PAS domain S-box-containing protein
MASLSEQHAVNAPSFGTSALSLDASSVAIALTDLSGRIEHANRAFQKLFGLSPAISVLHPDVMTVCVGCPDLSFLDAVARDGRHRQIEMPMRLSSGRAKRLLCSASRIDGEEGTPKWLSLSFVDISVSEANSAQHECVMTAMRATKSSNVDYSIEFRRARTGVGADVLTSINDALRRKHTTENLRRALQGERRVEEIRTHDRSQAIVRREIVYSPMLGLSREVIGVAVFQRELQEVAHIKHAPLRSWRRQEWFKPLQAAVALSAARK